MKKYQELKATIGPLHIVISCSLTSTVKISDYPEMSQRSAIINCYNYRHIKPCSGYEYCLKMNTINLCLTVRLFSASKGKGSPYSTTERRVPELIPVLGSQPAGDVSHKPRGRLPLLSARPAVTLSTHKRAATNFAACWTEAQWVWTVCLRLLPDNVATAILTRALLRLSRAC